MRSMGSALEEIMAPTIEHYVHSLYDGLSIVQMKWVAPTSHAQYTKWCRLHRMDVIIDEVGDNGGKLMWIGEKRFDRVLLYIHGK